MSIYKFYNKYFGPLLKTASYYIKDEDTAKMLIDDLLQKESKKSYHIIKKPLSYLHTAIANRCKNYLSSKKFDFEKNKTENSPTINSYEDRDYISFTDLEMDTREELFKLLHSTLDIESLFIFTLCSQGYSRRDVAQLLNMIDRKNNVVMTENNVSKKLGRARKKILKETNGLNEN